MKGKDANFEMVVSNSIQSLKLQYTHNIIKNSIAYIFVNDGYDEKTLPKWENANERGEYARALYEDILKF